MRIRELTLAVVLISAVAHAADLSTRDALLKKGLKLGDGTVENAKVLCICHGGGTGLSDGTLGVVGVFAFSGPSAAARVHVECYVPEYAFGTGEIVTSAPCVSSGAGTFWELVK